jgi:peroxiredoxin
MSLQEELAARVGGAKNWDPERKAAYQAQADALAASDILEKALRTGDRAPMFELPDAFGTTVRLAELLERGPVVLSFYRGSWCPFCNLELRALQRELEAASTAGVTLVAVSPNTPDMSRELLEEGGLTFPVLSDHECRVASQFNLVYEMVPEQVEYYRNHDRDGRLVSSGPGHLRHRSGRDDPLRLHRPQPPGSCRAFRGRRPRRLARLIPDMRVWTGRR